jgi:flavin-dependent dehydrogenase
MAIPKSCDVVVIGGGPAGSTAATLLAQKGYHVVLLEKAKHPRYVVGESLIPHFWKYCQATGVDKRIEEENFIQKAGGTVVWNGVIRQMAFKDFGYERPALHVERDRFDHILIQYAADQGVEVFQCVSALKADLQASNSKVEYRQLEDDRVGTINCKYVIDASGQSAVLARQLDIRMIDEGFRFMSIWGYFDGSKYVAADGHAYEHEKIRDIPPTTFVSNVDQWGWLWHIPLRENTSVGLILPKEKLKAIKASEESLEPYFLRQCGQIPHLDKLLENASFCPGSFHVIRDYSFRPAQLTGPGYFLIGDAAAFVDPIFSVGIVLAMYSAFLATWAVENALRSPSDAPRFQAIFAKQFLNRLEVSRALALPRYGYGEDDTIESAVGFETNLEQELMYVVSTLTTRSDNFVNMFQNKKGKEFSSNKYRVIDKIVI